MNNTDNWLTSSAYKSLKWITGEPIVRETAVQVLKIPASGSPPHLLHLPTLETTDNVDSFLLHIPDFRPYWGNREGFHWRDIVRLEVSDQTPPELNGVYWGWKSFAMDLLPKSEHTGFCGDAFIAKTPVWENDENGAVYEDVPAAFVGSAVMRAVVEKLRDR
ncbi:MAG: hypothetical protein Q9181_002780 [Wetmoreana brouardii]